MNDVDKVKVTGGESLNETKVSSSLQNTVAPCFLTRCFVNFIVAIYHSIRPFGIICHRRNAWELPPLDRANNFVAPPCTCLPSFVRFKKKKKKKKERKTKKRENSSRKNIIPGFPHYSWSTSNNSRRKQKEVVTIKLATAKRRIRIRERRGRRGTFTRARESSRVLRNPKCRGWLAHGGWETRRREKWKRERERE